MTVFGERVFKVKIRSLGWAPIQYDWHSSKKRSGHRQAAGRPCEDTGRRWPSVSEQGRRPEKNTALPAS